MSLRNIMGIVVTGITLVAFTGMANADEGTDWMNFGGEYGNAEDWSQPYDRSFARKYESQPARGYPTVQQENIAPLKEIGRASCRERVSSPV